MLDDVSVLDDGEVRERMDEALHRFIPEGALGGRLYNTCLDVFTPFMTAVAAVLGFLAIRKGYPVRRLDLDSSTAVVCSWRTRSSIFHGSAARQYRPNGPYHRQFVESN
jgi:hypothetical protein